MHFFSALWWEDSNLCFLPKLYNSQTEVLLIESERTHKVYSIQLLALQRTTQNSNPVFDGIVQMLPVLW